MGTRLTFQLAPEEGCRQFFLNRMGEFARWYFMLSHEYEDCYEPVPFKWALALVRQGERGFFAATEQEAAEVDNLTLEFLNYCGEIEQLRWLDEISSLYVYRYREAVQVFGKYSCEKTRSLLESMVYGRSLALTDFPYRFTSPDGGIFYSAWWSKEEVDWMYDRIPEIWGSLDDKSRDENKQSFDDIMRAINYARKKQRELMFCVG